MPFIASRPRVQKLGVHGFFTITILGVEVEKGRTLNESGKAVPAVARDEYSLTGWLDETGNAFTADTPVKSDMTVKAQWGQSSDPGDQEPSPAPPPESSPVPSAPSTTLPSILVPASRPGQSSRPNETDEGEDIPDDTPR